jgi:hypothetical protein
MIGLSTKLQERMTLNTGGAFPEFISSAPLKYWTVYHYSSTYPPRQPQQHQHQRQPQQWAPRPPQCQHQRVAPKALPLPPLRCACLHHRLLGPPPATPASTVVVRATSRESAPHRRRMPLRATSLIHHVVCRRWPLQRPTASTTPPCRIFPMASKFSRVHFL